MTQFESLKIFEERKVRSVFDDETEEWYFSVVDICAALTGTNNPRRYWSDLKKKLKAEGNETYDNIVQLKLIAEDGKYRQTDVATTEQILRLIQSIPSPKAEPFKLWMASVANQRLNQMADPELSIQQMIAEIRSSETGTSDFFCIVTSFPRRTPRRCRRRRATAPPPDQAPADARCARSPWCSGPPGSSDSRPCCVSAC